MQNFLGIASFIVIYCFMSQQKSLLWKKTHKN